MSKHRKCARITASVGTLLIAMTPLVWAQGSGTIAPPSSLVARDHSWDNGEQIDLMWMPSPDDVRVESYKVYRSASEGEVKEAEVELSKNAVKEAKAEATEAILKEAGQKTAAALSPEIRAKVREARRAAAAKAEEEAKQAAVIEAKKGMWKFVGFAPRGSTSFLVEKLEREASYTFKVVAVGASGVESAGATTASTVAPVRQLFDGTRFPLAVIIIILSGAVVLFILIARSGRPLQIRKIAGLDAVQEAVGRATEMGRSILFVPGIQDMNDIQTIAGLTVLSRVARTAADYDAKVDVPTSRSLVMTAAREAVQASYLAAGRPDAYNEDLIYYVTDEQFGYVAYVSGHMVRERPAACFYMGSFFAESLILAETGNSIGAIQVAGTAQSTQLPFFVAACDYTLIGEEFFAASAYLSGEADQLGSLKGQDVGKVLVAAIMAIGIAVATLGSLMHSEDLRSWAEFIRNTMLT